MSVSVVLWVCAAVVVFWALGAYNRLVRVRAELSQSLLAITTQWNNTAQTLRNTLQEFSAEPVRESQWDNLDNGQTLWRSLSLAAKQLQACLGLVMARSHALPPVDDLASLHAARQLLESAWRQLKDQHEDLAGAVVPPQLILLWQQHAQQSDEKLKAYNSQAQAYNQAIAQFPALLLAWIFSFHSTVNL